MIICGSEFVVSLISLIERTRFQFASKQSALAVISVDAF